jgi:hypothetical protein
MRGHEKYIEKVNDETNIYLHHLRTGEELEPRFAEAFEKIEIARAWVREGYSDTEVIQLLKNDKQTRLQARRAREVLALSYEIFADIRIIRNQDGVKQKYADEFNDLAKEIKDKIFYLIENNGTPKEIAELTNQWKSLKKEAANIDGAYLPTPKGGSGTKKPTKVIFKRKTIIQQDNDGKQQVLSDNTVEEAHYEIEQ